MKEIPVVYAHSLYDSLGPEEQKKASESGAGMPGMYNKGHRDSRGYTKDTFSSSMSLNSFDDMAPQRWKEVAFNQEMTKFYSRYSNQSWKNVLSIGDSIYERDAARVTVSRRPTKQSRCRVKTAKMLDEPNIEELTAQVKIVHAGLALMVKYNGNLDIEIDEDDLDADILAGGA
eukprot:gnl/MRDRNA2_/MRDRNA2_58035_c0_seq2.p1 gnl/MRDRNA2_/MRDRNA2_58035_c0~~gnl/MRDRNA2_/MRDRNA2_58035_c0_seq2.p1  ORF type:complete len:174 (+),score=39.58 gnl/MRDRNA2_/MRDRNA2_58035_c0_seq2:276-797(+)